MVFTNIHSILQSILSLSVVDLLPGIGNIPIIGEIAKIPLFTLLVLSVIFYFHTFIRVRPLRLMFKTVVDTFKKRDKSQKISNIGSLILQSILKVNIISILIITTLITSFGPGTMFWIWVFTLLFIMIPFLENFLAQKYHYYDENGHRVGGLHHYISEIWENKFGEYVGKLIMAIFVISIPVVLFSITKKTTEFMDINYAVINAIPAVLVTIIFLLVIFAFQKSSFKISKWFAYIAFAIILGWGFIYLASVDNFRLMLNNITANAFNLTALATGSIAFLLLIIFNSFTQNDLTGKGYNAAIGSQVDNTNPREQGMVGMLSALLGNVVLLTIICSPLIVNYTGVSSFGEVSNTYAVGFTNSINGTIAFLTPYIFMFAVVLLTIFILVMQYNYSREVISYSNKSLVSHKILKVLIVLAVAFGFYTLSNNELYQMLITLVTLLMCLVSTANCATMLKGRKEIVRENKKLLWTTERYSFELQKKQKEKNENND